MVQKPMWIVAGRIAGLVVTGACASKAGIVRASRASWVFAQRPHVTMAFKMAEKSLRIAERFVPWVVLRERRAASPKTAQARNAKDRTEIRYVVNLRVSMGFGTVTKRIMIAVDRA